MLLCKYSTYPSVIALPKPPPANFSPNWYIENPIFSWFGFTWKHFVWRGLWKRKLNLTTNQRGFGTKFYKKCFKIKSICPLCVRTGWLQYIDIFFQRVIAQKHNLVGWLIGGVIAQNHNLLQDKTCTRVRFLVLWSMPLLCHRLNKKCKKKNKFLQTHSTGEQL